MTISDKDREILANLGVHEYTGDPDLFLPSPVYWNLVPNSDTLNPDEMSESFNDDQITTEE